MDKKISRRRIANYAVSRLMRNEDCSKALSEIAGYLIDSKRKREASLIVRTIEDELAKRGIVIAHITTAYDIDDNTRNRIKSLIDAKEIYIDEIIDPSVIGGFKIETSGLSLDATIKRKLLTLGQVKI